MNSEFSVTKVDGSKELFDKSKLLSSLTRAGASDTDAEEIASYVVARVSDGVSTTKMYRMAHRELARRNRPIAARYSLRRALFDLGPTGFPFENFVGELFSADGYDVSLRQTLHGKCIEHEVDVLAVKGKETIAIEVKFHNTIGFKTDARAALYVKARMDDLKDPASKAGITDGMLITNTKFTTSAMAYAWCAGLRVTGWSYPSEESLLNKMTRLAIYPITALSTLSASQKRHLLGKEVVLCKSLKENRRELAQLGLSEEKIDEVLGEADGLCQLPHEARTTAKS